jgi:hypothetical protein
MTYANRAEKEMERLLERKTRNKGSKSIQEHKCRSESFVSPACSHGDFPGNR